MKRILISAAMLSALLSAPALAALSVGANAPDFTTKASLGGKEFDFSLADALKKGPVVLYFYPAAFTKGCTAEAHEFADATDKFKALGATVIGVSHDDVATLDKFSVSDCRNKFAVAADPTGEVIKQYDAAMIGHPAYADRISYVIRPDHKVIFAYKNGDYMHHVELTMSAVKDWHDTHHKRHA